MRELIWKDVAEGECARRHLSHIRFRKREERCLGRWWGRQSGLCHRSAHKFPVFGRRDDFRVGAVLPQSGVIYYDVPAEYHVTRYRYTYVNDHAVLVDPRTHRIVQIID